jgi:AraC-like DNA-binding protein
MQKAHKSARSPQNHSDVLVSETRQFTDVSEMNELYRGRADVRFIQKARGKVTATSQLTSIGPLHIQQLSWTGKLIAEATTASNRTTIIIPEPRERPAFISGEHLNDSQIMLYGPNSEHFTEMSGRSRGTQLFLPQGMLEQAIGARLQNDPMSLVSKRRLLNLGRIPLHALRQLVVEITKIIDEDNDEEVKSLCTSSLINNLVDRVSEALCRDATLASAGHDQHHSPSRLLTGVRDIFEESGRQSIQLYELCQTLGLSARTLQITFKQAYGISPMRYLKLRRLHAARERLLTTSAEDVSVKRASLENGFLDRSRFAEDFKKLFGHLPSETPRA